MNALLLTPPIAFLVVLAAMLLELWGLKIFSAGMKEPEQPGGRRKAYACGEATYEPKSQPDYRQFFPFAFFFTIMHVVALIVATVPRDSATATWLAAGYLVAAGVSLVILFRRDAA